MNERIRECWLKAAREDSSDKWDTQEEFIERFAQLIVRECVLISRTSTDGFAAGRRMEEQFGVEQ